ncbi:alpha/beta-hydrolase [Rhizodiscina lignyota]|uniref:Carboxylic ester hydrolase n=1 Tax=Rhizodiscina lignyota TaxID=1504668 RepID=A0A9P4M6E0_9PEZI|nr:alpha/beta-hydrolase [Rhizodiscina lignyota]
MRRFEAQTKNGTVAGIYNPYYNQDILLGIKFAQDPVGDLRLRLPVPVNTSWAGTKDATKRPATCPRYNFDDGLTIGEDCLSLDVVRPASTKAGDDLPVLFRLVVPGYIGGGTADPRFNGTFLVHESVEMGSPIVLVAINYRVMGFGFLASKEVVEAGIRNLGFQDQRLALRWTQENIRDFGGDPDKVTIWGESAGATSASLQLLTNDGDNEGLFRSLITESGSLVGDHSYPAVNTVLQLASTCQLVYDNITKVVGCANASDTLDCLRSMFPIIDGTFLKHLPSESFAIGKIAKNVAILIGSNTDEYHPVLGCLFGTGEERFASEGFQYKRGAAVEGTFPFMRESSQPVYTFRFDTVPWNGKEDHIDTVPHICHLLQRRPFQPYRDLSTAMSRSWLSFAAYQDPNRHGVAHVPYWPQYRNSERNIL